MSLFTFADDLGDSLRQLRGRRPVPRMLDFLDRVRADAAPPGDTSVGDLAHVCKRFASVQRNKGIVIVLSDFFDHGDIGAALKYLAGDQYDVYAIQLLAPQEIDPAQAQLIGDLNLRDVESHGLTEVSISPAVIKRYQEHLHAFCDGVKHECLRRDVAYLMSDTSTRFDDLVLRYLRERGLLG